MQSSYFMIPLTTTCRTSNKSILISHLKQIVFSAFSSLKPTSGDKVENCAFSLQFMPRATPVKIKLICIITHSSMTAACSMLELHPFVNFVIKFEKIRSVSSPQHTNYSLDQEANKKYNSLFQNTNPRLRIHHQRRAGMSETYYGVSRIQTY